MDHARVVIIGGGIVGCSVAYHLAQMGIRDVVLLEKGELTSGSTWHAAGLVGQLRSNRNVTRMLKHSVELYSSLGAETGKASGFKQVGSLRLASSPERMIELKKAATTAKSFGLEMHLLSPREARDLFPVMTIDGVEGAAFLPGDGEADPSTITQSLAMGARQGGVDIRRGVRVQEISVVDGRVQDVVTDHGTLRAETVVNAAGMWAREIGNMVGVNVPLIPVQHQYLCTKPIEGIPPDMPSMRDPDLLVYYKEETGGLCMGGYERNPIPWSVNGVPREFGQELLEENFDHFEQLYTLAIKRTPVLESAGVTRLVNGPEAFTPDGNFIMGPAPEVPNFFVAAGFNAHGIAAGGGAGRMLAEWIVDGRPGLDLWPVDIRRLGPHHRNLDFVENRTLELYGKHYTISWPHEEHDSAREMRKSPLYPTLRKQGAVYGQKYGWERPNWFAPEGVARKDEHSFDRPNWFEHVAEEHRTIREHVALIDQTSFGKIEIQGPGATGFLQSIADNNIDCPTGRLVYTQFLNDRGGIESDLTVARLGDDHFYLVTGTAFVAHDLAWIRSQLPEDGSIRVTDITETRAVINVCGPDSRRLLEEVSSDDLANEAFPFAHARDIRIGDTEILALRLTYVGELGYELHLPTDSAMSIYKMLMEAGKPLSIGNAGYRAIESCRLEKGYRYWSSDITADDNPLEAGLGFCVSFDSGDFTGREALLQVKENGGPNRKLCCFTLNEDRVLLGGETISHAGNIVGVLTSGGYGHTVRKTLAYGYVPIGVAKETEFEIEVLGEKIAATRQKKALYDPRRERVLS